MRERIKTTRFTSVFLAVYGSGSAFILLRVFFIFGAPLECARVGVGYFSSNFVVVCFPVDACGRFISAMFSLLMRLGVEQPHRSGYVVGSRTSRWFRPSDQYTYSCMSCCRQKFSSHYLPLPHYFIHPYRTRPADHDVCTYIPPYNGGQKRSCYVHTYFFLSNFQFSFQETNGVYKNTLRTHPQQFFAKKNEDVAILVVQHRQRRCVSRMRVCLVAVREFRRRRCAAVCSIIYYPAINSVRRPLLKNARKASVHRSWEPLKKHAATKEVPYTHTQHATAQ